MFNADWNLLWIVYLVRSIEEYSGHILTGKNILISFSKIAIVPIPDKQDLRCSWTMELAKLSARFAIYSMWNVCVTCGRKLHNSLGGGLYASRQYQLLSEVFPIMLTQPFSPEVCPVNGGVARERRDDPWEGSPCPLG